MEVLTELTRRRADLASHGRTTLERHLLGVEAMVRAWEQPEHVRLAALVHSAYSTEAYDFQLFGLGERGRLRELVGRRAEHLAFAFCACSRADLLRAASHDGSSSFHTRWKGSLMLDRSDLAALMVLHAANLVEQTCAEDGSPAPCLAEASRYLAAARHAGAKVPKALFDGGTVVMSRAAERSLLRRHAAMLGDDASPVGEPHVLRAVTLLTKRKAAEAARAAARGSELLDAWRAPWDKRLGVARWREIASHVSRCASRTDRELEAAVRCMRTAVRQADRSPDKLWAALDALGVLEHASRPAPVARRTRRVSFSSRFAQYIAGFRAEERPSLQFYPGLDVAPWHDARRFPIVRDLERLAPAIAKEAKELEVAGWQDEAENIRREGRWSVQFLLEMGRRRDDNLAKCPSLRWILDHHRTLTTHAGLMYFSCLGPRSRVAPHRGPTNVRLRCHLALEVPADCGIRVGGVARTWQEGRCIVFDDSFEHEVWNDSSERRIVLVLDLWHPDLSKGEVELLAGLHRYAAANDASTQRYWARNEDAARKARDRRDPALVLAEQTAQSMREGRLEQAAKHALEYAQLCRGTRWYPVRRDDDPPLPEAVKWQRLLTPAKLVHDIEQLRYLQRRGIMGEDLTPVIERYERLLDTLRPLGETARVPLVGVPLAEVGHVYNRLVHVRRTARAARALSGAWKGRAVEDEYLSRRPSVAVVDDFLSERALRELRLFCLESTVWSTNRYDHGRLGSFFRDGFNCSVLIQIAEELRAALPRLIGERHPVTQLWGYKYATTQPALSPHADFAAVNVNFWITPDDANLDPKGGGLVVYDLDAPRDWDFESYNRGAAKIRRLLDARKAKATHIPYRCNRAVIFDSDLFHTTPALAFKPGYENRRVNVTVLFGDRRDAWASEPARRVQ